MNLLTYTPPEQRPAPLRTMDDLDVRPKRRPRRPDQRAEQREIREHILPQLNNSLISRVLKSGRLAIVIGVNRQEYSWIVMDPAAAQNWLQGTLDKLEGTDE